MRARLSGAKTNNHNMWIRTRMDSMEWTEPEGVDGRDTPSEFRKEQSLEKSEKRFTVMLSFLRSRVETPPLDIYHG